MNAAYVLTTVLEISEMTLAQNKGASRRCPASWTQNATSETMSATPSPSSKSALAPLVFCVSARCSCAAWAK